ncbi:MarR family transcriptional regulator [Streptomycetaceae bacterium NBC_01309]
MNASTAEPADPRHAQAVPAQPAPTGEPAAADVSGAPGGADPAAEAASRAWVGMRELVLNRFDKRKAVSEALGMSFVRGKALRRLAKGPLTMRELAEKLATDKPYTTLVVDDLERRGLIERSVHPTDRRQRVVTATEAGVAAARVAEAILGAPPPILAALPPEDLAALDRIVARLIAGAGEPPDEL